MNAVTVRSLTVKDCVSLIAPLSTLADDAFPTVKRHSNRVVGYADGKAVLTLYNDGRLFITGDSFNKLRENRAVVSDRLQTDGLLREPLNNGSIVTGLVDFGDYIDPETLNRMRNTYTRADDSGTLIKYDGAVEITLRFVGVSGLASIDVKASIPAVEESLQELNKEYERVQSNNS